MAISVASTEWLFHPLFPGQTGIWESVLVFVERGKLEYPGKTVGARMRTNNKFNPHMMPTWGVKPRPHWWEESALTTMPSLLPPKQNKKKKEKRGKSEPTGEEPWTALSAFFSFILFCFVRVFLQPLKCFSFY